MPTRVIVLGGGVAGMSAAHELIERGFEVVVLERRDIAGGKARSIPVIDDGAGTSGHERADTGVKSIQHRLPGEHGFRFFPGFYKHVIDTMRRIPSFDGRTVSDHLVPTTRVGFTQYGKPTFLIPAIFPQTPADAGTLLRDILLAFESCHRPHARRSGVLRRALLADPHLVRRSAGSENTSGRAGGSSSAPRSDRRRTRSSSPTGFTRSLVAAKARKASARTIGDMFVQLMLTILNPTAGSTDRVLDGPTNLVWIDPWLQLSRIEGCPHTSRNVKVEEILCDKGRITGVAVRQQEAAHRGAWRPLCGGAAARAHCPAGEPAACWTPIRRSPICARWRRTWSG